MPPLAGRPGPSTPRGIFTVLIILALLAVGLYGLMSRLERRLLHWQGESVSI